MSTVQTLLSITRIFNSFSCIRKHSLGFLLLVALPLGAQTLDVDMVAPMNTSTPGAAFTTAIGNAGTVCSSGTTCSWSSVTSGGSYSPTFLVGANQGAFTNLGPVQVNGTGGALYAIGSLNHNSIGHEDGDVGPGSNATLNISGAISSANAVSVLVPITLTMPGEGQETYAGDLDMFGLWQVNGNYDMLQLNAQNSGTACDGITSGQIGIRLEGKPTIHTPCIPVTAPGSYYVSVYWNLVTGFTQMYVYTATGTQVPCVPGIGGGQGTCNADGSTSVTMGATGTGLFEITVGNNEAGYNNGTITYFQNIMMNWTTAPKPFFWTGSGTAPVAPVITSATTANGTEGAAFSYQITATNTPTSFSATGLPGGMSVNTSTGLISGTSSAEGTSTVTLGATNSAGTGTAALTLTMAAPALPAITSAATSSGTAGVAYAYQITATNTPTSYGAAGLPAGLSINASTGLISGTPTAAGSSTVTLSATNSTGTGTAPLTLTVASASTGSGLWAGVLAPSRAINWSNSGVVGGIPARTNICSTLMSSATTAPINAAIVSCSTVGGGVVLLSAGTYSSATGGFSFNGASNVTVRGAGANQTILAPTSSAITVGSADTNWRGNPENLTTWSVPAFPSGKYPQGTSQITLAKVANLKVGNPIILDQLDPTTDNGGILVSQATTAQQRSCSWCHRSLQHTQGSSQSMRGPSNGACAGNATCWSQEQIVTVTSCNGVTTLGAACSGSNVVVGISSGLEMPNWTSTQTPEAWWALSPALNDGVEDLSVNLANCPGCDGLNFFNAQNSWVKGVSVTNSSGEGMLRIEYGNHISIVNNYMALSAGGTGSYGADAFSATDCLIANNIMQGVTTPQISNGTTSGCVFAYNYSINGYFSSGPGYNIPAHGDHGSGVGMVLVEGNIANGATADVIHGTTNLNTHFRNFFTGTQPACYASGSSYATSSYEVCNNNVEPELVLAFHRFYNLIGNILGTTNTNTTYETSTIINGVPTAVLAG